MSLKILKNASLQALNTMAVSAEAAYLTEVQSFSDIIEACKFAQRESLSVFVLGEGSNTLFKRNYPGLVLLNRLLGIELVEEDDKSVLLKVAAGENWHKIVSYTIQQHWYGLENLALIPGLVGAAPMQNIGAYGVEVKDSITAVEFLSFASQEPILLLNKQCQFAYRDSIFKHELLEQGVITAVFFRLTKAAKPNVSYPALSTYFSEQALSSPTPSQVFEAVCAIRKRKLPAPADIPNLGSFFKNPIVDRATFLRLIKEHPQLVSYPHMGGYKLAAAWLIDTAGWKAKVINNISVHSEQALVIINPNRENGLRVFEFAEAIKKDIADKFGIDLQIEPVIV